MLPKLRQILLKNNKQMPNNKLLLRKQRLSNLKLQKSVNAIQVLIVKVKKFRKMILTTKSAKLSALKTFMKRNKSPMRLILLSLLSMMTLKTCKKRSIVLSQILRMLR